MRDRESETKRRAEAYEDLERIERRFSLPVVLQMLADLEEETAERTKDEYLRRQGFWIAKVLNRCARSLAFGKSVN